MVLVSRGAPDFTASAVLGSGEIIDNFNLLDYIDKKEAIVFFWPMDFTFVCPSELIACDKRYIEFQKRNVEVIGVSIDSVFVHSAWRKIPISQGGIGSLQYTMVSDVKHEIIKKYGIEHLDKGVALRASFLIDKLGVIRHQVVNDLPFGRNFDEMIRMVDALQFHEIHGLLCPAQWSENKEGLEASQQGVINYLIGNFSQL
ncbi:peroxiredoxin C [Candidatus Blochmannia vicinus]|uniref:Alkyl hydroperoxide reductase protein C22 n=1 Tax=Candidatus Blochmannia vicinus (nom. nud.) TaxID=251540 RepID=A0A9Q8X117_9ENTR|nr:peroxiredoxin C [Candidatus Blochmannia vicinus]URJ27965.1 peroxiredoxin C [Candidatus Blochmannia vicinus]URJ32906.1 peroxiredoxin C [Candidatus Blochmannia vicinus]